MPMAQKQIDEILDIIDGVDGINHMLSKLTSRRKRLHAFLQINETLREVDVTTEIEAAKVEARAAADALKAKLNAVRA